MSRDWKGLLRRGLGKPPRVVLARLLRELRAEGDRLLLNPHWCGWREPAIAAAGPIGRLWGELGRRPFPAPTGRDFAQAEPALVDRQRIFARAEAAIAHRVDLLGSGPIELGPSIDWHRDYRTGYAWPLKYAQRMPYGGPPGGPDVKFPWELSRLQWLIPAGQAYLLAGEERFARAAREVLESWIEANPCGWGVNWACTMEAALRVVSWSWFFHMFHASKAWSEPAFQARFLSMLYRHARFTERYLERSDVNGNHYTANAAGLVFAGLLLEGLPRAARWHRVGWSILCGELPKQVFADGVDFEASTAYHRLVLELFLLPALYREARGLQTPPAYRERLVAMGRFVAAYSRPEGSVPLWGDADDGRLLPLGGQAINDHRYLLGLLGAAWDVDDLREAFSGPREEVYWLLGAKAAALLPDRPAPPPQSSTSFPQGGVFVMRNGRDHVFIDCGPVGLQGRGGHGHNDCLSLEAVLDGVHLITDSGTYIYTGSYAQRQRFRSTASHNTPQADGEELNRLAHPNNLWALHDDAQPCVLHWEAGSQRDVFRGSHTGYERLRPGLRPTRTVVLDHEMHRLLVCDEFTAKGARSIIWRVPLHFAAGVTIDVEAEERCDDGWRCLPLMVGDRNFDLVWLGAGTWTLRTEACRVSPSYGVAIENVRAVWEYQGSPQTRLFVALGLGDSRSSLTEWAREAAGQLCDSCADQVPPALAGANA